MRTVITESLPITHLPAQGAITRRLQGEAWLCGLQTGQYTAVFQEGYQAQLGRRRGLEGAQHRERGVAKPSN